MLRNIDHLFSQEILKKANLAVSKKLKNDEIRKGISYGGVDILHETNYLHVKEGVTNFVLLYSVVPQKIFRFPDSSLVLSTTANLFSSAVLSQS